jgi:hypothetical protein
MKGKMILAVAATLAVGLTAFYVYEKDNCTDGCKVSTAQNASCDKCGKTTCDKNCSSNTANTEGGTKLLPSCSLEAAAQVKRGNEVLAQTFSKAKTIKELPEGYDMVFAHSTEMVAELNEIAAFERKCCASFTWEVVEDAAQKQVHLKAYGSDAVKKELKPSMVQLGLAHLME